MSDTIDDIRPYSLEVGLKGKSEHNFQWTIRKHGRLYQRSDRNYLSEAKARGDGMAAIERLLTKHD